MRSRPMPDTSPPAEVLIGGGIEIRPAGWVRRDDVPEPVSGDVIDYGFARYAVDGFEIDGALWKLILREDLT